MFKSITPSDLFMTGLYLSFNDHGQVFWAAAGHDPPLRISRFAGVKCFDSSTVGLPLGLETAEVYKTTVWDLEPGERLLIFTDGVVEATNCHGEPFGRRRLQSSVQELVALPLEDLVGELVSVVSTHVESSDFDDDFSIIAAERIAKNIEFFQH
jgi:serine phosphatase RsbU (regulator of sigma subunit)